MFHEILYLPIPRFGEVLIMRDTVTLRRFDLENDDTGRGAEYLLYLGTLRVYFTPWSTLRAYRSR